MPESPAQTQPRTNSQPSVDRAELEAKVREVYRAVAQNPAGHYHLRHERLIPRTRPLTDTPESVEKIGEVPPSGTMEGMTLTTFALVRHGQTDWNAQRRLQGATDIPLNDVGRGQARGAAANLSGHEWDAVVSSPLSRAAETAALIAEGLGLGLSVVRHVPELTERSFGQAEGLQAGPELEALRTPGGFQGAESEDAAANRGLTALEALAEEFRGRRVLVVAHGTLLRVSLSRAIGRTLHSIDNAVLNLAHHHVQDGWRLEYYNGQPLAADVQA